MEGVALKTKEKLQVEIAIEINNVNKAMKNTMFSNDLSDATNRVALSNLYIALSNLIR